MNSKEQLKQFKHIYMNFLIMEMKNKLGEDFKAITERKTIDLVKMFK